MINRSTQTALSISFLYAIFATLWVFLSDRVLERLVSDPHQLITIELYKGWVFVAVSALLIFALLRRELTRNKVAYEALQESQRRHATLLSNLPGMAYRCRNDRDWTMLFISNGCIELTGYQPGDLVNNDTIAYAQLIHPDDRERAAEHVAASVDRREPFQMTYRIGTASGEQKWVWAQGRGVFSPEGDLLALEGFVTDFTQHNAQLHQEIQQRLNENESLQRVTTALLQQLTLNHILEVICTETQRMSGAHGSTVFLREEEEWLQVPHRAGSFANEKDGPLIGESFAELAVAQKRPILINDSGNAPSNFRANPTLQSLLVLPLIANGEGIGALHVFNKPGGFSDDDTRILSLVAAQAAIAIENARLHEQTEGSAVLAERHRLARELHDSVTQSIYSVILFADATRLALASEKATVAAENLRELRRMAGTALADMRLLLYELHPPELAEEGLIGALHTRLDAVESRAGLQVDFNATGEVDLPLALEDELYKIAQEALNNVIKHANAGAVAVQVDCADGLFCMTIQDDGAGFDPDAAHARLGLGLRGIAERVQQINGRLSIRSAPGQGTTLRVTVDHAGGENNYDAQSDPSAHR